MLKVGVVGCGNISGIYFDNAKRMSPIEIVACADLDIERTAKTAAKHEVTAYSVEELIHGDVDIVLNLTTPESHYSVAKAAISAGKHVYNEKPLTISKQEGSELLQLADSKCVRVGCAPDTFLGAGYQTVRKVIDEGGIGKPTSFTAFMLCPGHESWHPNPFFYYEVGGGPMFDMGPYYLTALVHLFGPVKRVSGTTSKAFDQRLVTSQPHAGEIAKVHIPTHVQCLLEMESGVVGMLITSFDVKAHTLPHIQVYGTEATLTCPDPNGFGGQIMRGKGSDWEEIPLQFPNSENSRGLGLADMADAIESGRNHRASGELAHHVLEIMHAAHESAEAGQSVVLNSGIQPAPMPAGLNEFELD
ncbi:MAG: Gfo/Idh/MocA family oxidoreductase [Fimbriimonadaceae bacterium]|nr:MAG: Gfo/Idh/MocA family oxidoreductase [Fimbriimonadaceae bacterium]